MWCKLKINPFLVELSDWLFVNIFFEPEVQAIRAALSTASESETAKDHWLRSHERRDFPKCLAFFIGFDVFGENQSKRSQSVPTVSCSATDSIILVTDRQLFLRDRVREFRVKANVCVFTKFWFKFEYCYCDANQRSPQDSNRFALAIDSDKNPILFNSYIVFWR